MRVGGVQLLRAGCLGVGLTAETLRNAEGRREERRGLGCVRLLRTGWLGLPERVARKDAGTRRGVCSRLLQAG